MSEVHLLFHQPIADHSFSRDRNQLAVARDTRVQLYRREGKGFTPDGELADHDKTVTSVDIAPESGKIVTCSQDRNALVWEKSATGTWKPTLVLLRINRAATTVRWSPDEKKFAVGSGARVIAVCYFEEENDWWVSKHLKKPLRSTVLSLSWHPNSVLLAAGSADAHARVFSAFIKGVDHRPAPTAWGERLPFNTVCGEFTNSSGGWVHAVSFSPSGSALAYAAHDSSVTVIYPSAPEQPPTAVLTITTQMLPFTSLLWSREDQIIAAGHDCHPVVFEGDVNGWRQAFNIDDPNKARQESSQESSALNMFRQMDLKGRTTTTDDSSLKTIHQNAIMTLRPHTWNGENVASFSTSGVDGRLVIFPMRA